MRWLAGAAAAVREGESSEACVTAVTGADRPARSVRVISSPAGAGLPGTS